jgi:hypothetical protein
LGWSGQIVTIIGKGPSLSFVSTYEEPILNSITLNHACETISGKIAHFTDLEALLDCGKTITSSNSLVVMPNYPHIYGMPTDKDLLALSKEIPLIDQLVQSRRIYTYAGSNSQNSTNLQEIELRYFSIEPAYQIACLLGAKKILTFGIDGGNRYSSSVSQVGRTRLLENGRKTFDSQFKQVEKLINRHGIEMEPAMKPIQIFVGASDTELIPFLVLKHSIESHSSRPVNVQRLPLVRKKPKHRRNRPRTPFSFSRFLIPSLMNFEGKAIYLDSDMLVFSDITDLYNHKLGDKHLGVTVQHRPPEKWKSNSQFQMGRQFSVMVIDCEKSQWKIDEIISSLNSGDYSYHDLMYSMKITAEDKIDDSIDPSWNSLENYDSSSTKLLHFTVVPTQPWKSKTNDYYHIWINSLVKAVEDGAVTAEEIKSAIKIGAIGNHVLDDVPPTSFQSKHQNSKPSSYNFPTPGLAKTANLKLKAAIRNSLWRLRNSR